MMSTVPAIRRAIARSVSTRREIQAAYLFGSVPLFETHIRYLKEHVREGRIGG